MVTDFIQRVRAALHRDGVTPGGLARKAGLHRNSLYKVHQPDWNPTAEVLTKLEPHIEAIEAGTWQAEPQGDESLDAAA